MRRSFSLRLALLAALASALSAAPAAASTYIGAAVGQSRITASDPSFGASQFIEHDTAFKLTAGFKGPLGVELEYLDFGKSDGQLGSQQVSGKQNALAAFALVPVPDLIPVFDLYGKVGFARLDTHVTGNQLDFNSRGTDFAWGLGARFKVGSLGIRAEYERFKRGGRDPAMLSLGLVKYFNQD